MAGARKRGSPVRLRTSPFQKTLVRGEKYVGTIINQSVKICLIRKIRERADLIITNDKRRSLCRQFRFGFQIVVMNEHASEIDSHEL